MIENCKSSKLHTEILNRESNNKSLFRIQFKGKSSGSQKYPTYVHYSNLSDFLLPINIHRKVSVFVRAKIFQSNNFQWEATKNYVKQNS